MALPEMMMERMYVRDLTDAEKNELTLYNNESLVYAYDEVIVSGESMFRIPRYYKKHPAGSYNDLTTTGEIIDINIKPNYRPRDERQERAIDAIMSNNHGLISANVSFGKTFVAVYSMAQIRRKTLIVVHKEPLLEQWIDRIVEYTNLTKDDIGIIKADKADFDKPVCLTTSQTLSRRVATQNKEFIKSMYQANFGITFYDECHITAAAPAFSESTKTIFSRCIYGLSATIYRSDGLTKLLEWHVGKPIFNEAEFQVKSIVGLIDIPLDPGSKTKNWIEGGADMSLFSRYAQFLVKNETYVARLASLIDQCIDNGRQVLVLSSLIKMLTVLKAASKHGDKIGIIHGQTKEREYDKQCLLATTGFFKDGMDIPRLDTLIYATPLTSKNSLVQSIGRVSRSRTIQPLVFDINNSAYDVFDKMRASRLKYYADFKFTCVALNSPEDVLKLINYLNKK